MKKLFYFLVSIVLLVGLQLSCTQEELPGGVYGTVVDKESGEPIRSVGVELSPLGQKTVTGSDGQYEFVDVEAGTYNLFVTKTDYKEESISFEVKPGQKTKVDIQIVKLPPALKVLDDDRNEIKSLDFGADEGVVMLSFNILNDGAESISWKITKTSDWVKSISESSGVLQAGAIQPILVTIDRSLLSDVESTTILHVTSDYGSKQIEVRAQLPMLPPVTRLRGDGCVVKTWVMAQVSSSGFTPNLPKVSSRRDPLTGGTTVVQWQWRCCATLCGQIVEEGRPAFSECGFVYAESEMPTIETSLEKLPCTVNTDRTFQATTEYKLVDGRRYYVRAYAKNELGVYYSENEVIIMPEH